MGLLNLFNRKMQEKLQYDTFSTMLAIPRYEKDLLEPDIILPLDITGLHDGMLTGIERIEEEFTRVN